LKSAEISKNKKSEDQVELSETNVHKVELMSKWRVNETYSDDEKENKILSLLSGK
jgi:hypothetical protein